MIRNFWHNRSGAVSVSTSFVLFVFILLIGGSAELANTYQQANNLQHAAKTGVRIAITTEPVAEELITMTGLEGGLEIGSPMPDYKIICSGKNMSCNRGGFNNVAFNKIFYGRDNDAKCQSTTKERQGLCDVFSNVTADKVTITYQSSGMGRAGSPPDLIPLVTLRIENIDQDFVFLDILTAERVSRSLSAQAMSVGEDLK